MLYLQDQAVRELERLAHGLRVRGNCVWGAGGGRTPGKGGTGRVILDAKVMWHVFHTLTSYQLLFNEGA